jgi:hypothetical protein
MKIVIGQTLLDRYRVDAFLASGGMGAVYRVWDLKRNVPLAMKVLHSNLGEDPAVFKSFKREAISLKKLAHPNIVPFYGLYEEGENAFLLQRFIDGPTLKELLNENKGRPIPVADALVYLKTIAAALHFAHSSTVVHCDVKPGNVLLDKGGNVYLTDFGIARHADSTTTTMVGLGTPAYMAPEQILEKSVSPATDIYALGVMLFEMVTGQRPFQGNEKGTETAGPTVRERIIYGHLQLPPPDPRSINPQISVELSRAILKALEKDPKHRYSSTQELFEAVSRAMGWNSAQVPDRVQVQGWEGAEKRFSEGTGQSAASRFEPAAGMPAGMGTQVGRNKGLVAVIFGGLVLFLVGAMIAFSGNGSRFNNPATNEQGESGSGYVQSPQTPSSATEENVEKSELSATPLRDAASQTVEKTGGIDKTPGPDLPPAPQPPVDPNDQVAMGQYLNALQSYQEEITKIQNEYLRQIEHNEAQARQVGEDQTDLPIPTNPPTPTDLPTQIPLYTDKKIIGRSVSGRDLLMTVIGYPGEKALVVVGAIDGSQTDTTSVVNDLINRYESNPTLIPTGTLLYLIPSINPDGSRRNRNGVDLNRNWDTSDWRSNPPQPGAAGGMPGAGGSRPLSEPESQALRDVLVEVKNRGQELILVVLHSSVRRGDLIYPAFIETEAHSPSVRVASEMGAALNYTYDTSWDDYQTPGEAIDWAALYGIPAVDIVWLKNQAPSIEILIKAFAVSGE